LNEKHQNPDLKPLACMRLFLRFFSKRLELAFSVITLFCSYS